MRTKTNRMFIVFGLLIIIVVIASSAVISHETSQIRLRKSKGKIERFEKPAEVVYGTTSAKVTTAGAKKNRFITVRQLTTNPDEDRFPDWSPDGQWIVFQAIYPSYYNYGVWKINVDGTGLTPLAEPDTTVYTGMCFSKPRWSPLGTKILYQSYGDTTHGGDFYASTYIMDPDGSNRERVSPDTQYCRSHANWSPDGNKMAYKNYRFSERLTILDLNTGLETDMGALVPENLYQWNSDFPKFSPDGNKLLFKGNPGEHLCVIDTSGNNFIEIDDVNYNKHWDWSPNGDKIVYNIDRDGSSILRMMIANDDGTGKRMLLDDAINCFTEVEWQPISPVANGNWIIYARSLDASSDQRDIWVVSTDGRYTGCLFADTATGGRRLCPTWSPEGDRIVFNSDCYGNYDIFVIDLDTDDNDFDLLLNWEEFAAYGTDPDDRDTDDGDENDGSEVFAGRDPFNPADDIWAPPYTDQHDPAPGDTGVVPDVNIIVHVKDDGAGVDISTIVMTVEGSAVTPTITGAPHDYTLTYDPPASFNPGQYVHVTVNTSDLAISPHVMPTDAYFFTISTVGVEEGQTEVPTEFNLFQNIPNPTHDMTTIRFQIPHTTFVTLRIYDAAGRLVRTLVDESKGPGFYSVNWDLRDNSGETVSSGIYYQELKAADYKSAKKIVVK